MFLLGFKFMKIFTHTLLIFIAYTPKKFRTFFKMRDIM
jgi:hypothetical protein